MKSIFKQLWNGNIKPYETNGINDPEIEELSGLIERNKASLNKLLDEEQKKVLNKYVSCCDSYYYLLVVHAFRKGFSLPVSFWQKHCRNMIKFPCMGALKAPLCKGRCQRS